MSYLVTDANKVAKAVEDIVDLSRIVKSVHSREDADKAYFYLDIHSGD